MLLFLNNAPCPRVIRRFIFLRAADKIRLCSSNNFFNSSCLSRYPASPYKQAFQSFGQIGHFLIVMLTPRRKPHLDRIPLCVADLMQLEPEKPVLLVFLWKENPAVTLWR
jgi:hypothetical protein